MITVTQSLVVGTRAEAETAYRGRYTETVEEAYHAVKEGFTAVLPVDEEWGSKARTLLARFGATPDEIDQRICFALTGRLFPGDDSDVMSGINS